jgi:hypothetical protein
MKKNMLLGLLVSIMLLAIGVMFAQNPKIGTTLSDNDVSVSMLMAGCAKTGGSTNVCYGGNCSSGGCGCTVAPKILDDPSGTAPMNAEPCSTSSCTTPQGLTNNSCGG